MDEYCGQGPAGGRNWLGRLRGLWYAHWLVHLLTRNQVNPIAKAAASLVKLVTDVSFRPVIHITTIAEDVEREPGGESSVMMR